MEKASDSKIKKLIQKRNDLRTEVELLHATHIRSVRALLTEKQKTKFDTHYLSGKDSHGRGKTIGPKRRHGWGRVPMNK